MGRKSREKKERMQGESPRPFLNKPQSKIELVCLGIIRGAVYLMLLTPLIVSGRFFFPFVGPKGLYLFGLIEIAFFSWLILAIYNPSYRPRKNILLLAIGVFLMILTLAAVFGVDPSRSFWSKFERMSGVLMWYHLFALFLVASSVFRKKEEWLKIFLSSIFVAVITCFIFWLDKGGVKNLPVASLGSTLGNSSFFATYLLFNLFFAVYVFYSIKKLKKVRPLLFFRGNLSYLIFLVLSILFLALTLMFSTGRAATLAFFGGIGLLFLLYWSFEFKETEIRRLGKIALIISIIIFIAGLVLLHWPNSPVQQWLSVEAKKSRQATWQNAIQGLKERPVLGWGPQNFSFVYNKFFIPQFYLPDEYGPNVRFDQAHNIIMDNLVDAGILGLMGYLSILGIAIYVLWKKYRENKLDFWTAAVPTTLLVAHFTQNLTVFDMPVSFLMFFLTLSFIGALSEKRSQDSLERTRKKSSNFVLTTLITSVLFVFCFVNFVIYPARADTGMIKAMRAIPNQSDISLYNQALYSSPMGIYQIRTYLANELIKKAEKKKQNYSLDEFELMIKELEKSVKSSPLDYFSRLLLGRLYSVYGEVTHDAGKVTKGEEIVKKAISLAPTRQEGYWELSKIEFLLDKKKEAIDSAEKAVELEPRVAYSQMYLVNLAKVTGNKELALQKAREAVKILPKIKPQLEKILGLDKL